MNMWCSFYGNPSKICWHMLVNSQTCQLLTKATPLPWLKISADLPRHLTGFDLWPFCTCPVLFRLEKLSPNCTYMEHWSVSGEMFSISDRMSNINCVFVYVLSFRCREEETSAKSKHAEASRWVYLETLTHTLSADYIVLIILVQ